MEKLALLLLKANVAIIVFTLFYWLFLRNVTFYRINRIYLLFAIIFTLAFPFIEISFFAPAQLAVIPDFIPQLLTAPAIVENNTGIYILSGIWFAGVAIFFIRLGLQLYSLYQLHRQSTLWQGQKNIRIVNDEISPFSFGPYIYINPQLHSSQQLNIVLLHEQVHIKQKHTIDILLVEFLLLLNWFNPAVWLLRKAVKENLEYATDSQVLKTGVMRKEYQYHLLSTTCTQPVFTVQNSFNIADLKKRIIQMNMKRTANHKLFSYSLIPVLSSCLLLLNKPVQHFAEDVLGITPENINNNIITPIKENSTNETQALKTVHTKQEQYKKKKNLQAASSLNQKQSNGFDLQTSTNRHTANIKNIAQPTPTTGTEIIVTGYATPKKTPPVKVVQGVEIKSADKEAAAISQEPNTNQPIKVVQGYPINKP